MPLIWTPGRWSRPRLHPADEGDTTTITGTLDAARRNLTRVGAPSSPDDPAECVADKGYHSRALLKDLGRPVVLIHGNGTMAEDFVICGLVNQLAKSYRVIAVD